MKSANVVYAFIAGHIQENLPELLRGHRVEATGSIAGLLVAHPVWVSSKKSRLVSENDDALHPIFAPNL